MLADIKLMPFHGGPVPRRRRFNLVAQSWNAPDGVKCELKAVEVVEHDHVKRRRRGTLVSEAADVNIVVVIVATGKLERTSRPGDQVRCDASESVIERGDGGCRIRFVELFALLKQT
jgi:hypothetical protein